MKKFVRLNASELVDVDSLKQISINQISRGRYELLARVEGSDDIVLYEGRHFGLCQMLDEIEDKLKTQEIDLEKIIPLVTPLIALFAEKQDDKPVPSAGAKAAYNRIDDLESALVRIRSLCSCIETEKQYSFDNIYSTATAVLEGRETVGGA